MGAPGVLCLLVPGAHSEEVSLGQEVRGGWGCVGLRVELHGVVGLTVGVHDVGCGSNGREWGWRGVALPLGGRRWGRAGATARLQAPGMWGPPVGAGGTRAAHLATLTHLATLAQPPRVAAARAWSSASGAHAGLRVGALGWRGAGRWARLLG